MRTEATIGGTNNSQGAQLFDEESVLPRREKMRKRAKAAASIDDAQFIVSLALPSVTQHDVQQAAACNINVLASADEKSCVWVELTVESLAYVRAALLASSTGDACEEPKPKKEAMLGGVRFRADRKCYIAFRVKHDKKHPGHPSSLTLTMRMRRPRP